MTICTLANLVLVSETRIIAERSPIFSGQFTAKTPEKSLFKLLLSGIDDSALISYPADVKASEDNLAKIAAGVAFLNDARTQLYDEGNDETELRGKVSDFEMRLALVRSDTGQADSNLLAVRRRIRRIAETHDIAEHRIGELGSMLSRFELLEDHYQSDLARLNAIAEAACSLDTLAPGPCPLCGAAADAQNHAQVCEADLPALAEAATAEGRHINRLRADLVETIKQTENELHGLRRRIADLSRQDASAKSALKAAEEAAHLRRIGYAELFANLVDIKDKLREFDALRELEARLSKMKGEASESEPEMPVVAAPRTYTDAFAQEVAQILAAWKVPGCERVSFDAAESDLQLNNKLRSAQGKGLRALTHAAFAIGLMVYCLKNDRPHPGFVVLDSPLLSYRGDEIEEAEENLKSTSVDEAFYNWLARDLPAGQVIVIENREAP
ncbi:MAG TPA: hypothetical protein VLW88_05595, partial [Hyphomicrobium sp.]|nr:hypothetical protein [Hyphomicrobium sp.]